MDDNRNYAYLFEDQWPLYGDYDMNDLVLIIKERKISINKSNKAEEFTLSLDLSAAGATKSIELLSCWTVFLPVPLRSRWNSVTTLFLKVSM